MPADILSSQPKSEEHPYLSPEKIMQLGLAFWGSKDLDKLPQVLTWAGAAALRSEWAAVSRPRPLDVAGSY